MLNHSEIIAQIANRTGGVLRDGTEVEINKLRILGLPDSVLKFYSSCSPEGCIEEQVRLWSPLKVIEENTDLVPGCYVSKLGYVVFSSTLSGDAYCFDLTSLSDNDSVRIVLISHEIDDELLQELEPDDYVKPIADDLVSFLKQFEAGTLDEEPLGEEPLE